jgi:beta-barrel assembly-enhancing protease
MISTLLRFCMVAFLVPAIFSCNTLTDFFISDEQEVQMGDKFKAQILADPTQYPQYKNTNARTDSVIKYVEAIGNKIVDVQHDRKKADLHFDFTLIDNDTMINAFAVPGGHVFVYTGLLKAAKSGAEVAGVMAHEIGHVTMRHGANQLMKAEAFDVVNQVLFGNDSASIASAVTKICANLLFLKFSREDEYQADSCAVAYTVAAQYNPYGSVHFFETLKAKYGGGMGPFEMVSTHPDTDKRISEVKRIIAKTPNAPADDGTTWMDPSFAAIKAKI